MGPGQRPWLHTRRRDTLRCTATCKCGCGEPVKGRRVFVNREYHLDWMYAGGASQMNALQPIEAKIKGGATAGQQAAESGRVNAAWERSAELSREFAAEYRAKRGLS
jgi:hypothetical protein